jgi:peptidoglycan/LPS O-acetylase OafA/YrhL
MVLGLHAYGVVWGWDPPNWMPVIRGDTPFSGWLRLLLEPLTWGRDGVALFFVLSGYVIHRSCLNGSNLSWAEYAQRRFWRIYPAYLVALIGFSLWDGIGSNSNLISHLTLTHNIFPATFYGLNSSFWSLATEAQLYLLYPIICVIRNRKGMGWSLVFGCVVSLAWTLAAIAFGKQHAVPVSMSPIALWPSWILGACLAEAHQSGERFFTCSPLRWWILAGIAWIVTLLVRGIHPSTEHFLAAALLCALILETYLSASSSLSKSAKAVATIGTCSYSLYLIHQPIMERANVLLEQSGIHSCEIRILCIFFILAPALIGTAWVMYLTIERGGISIGKRISGERLISRTPARVLTNGQADQARH